MRQHKTNRSLSEREGLSEHLRLSQLNLGFQRELAETLERRLSRSLEEHRELFLGEQRSNHSSLTAEVNAQLSEVRSDLKALKPDEAETTEHTPFTTAITLGELRFEMIICDGQATFVRVGDKDLKAYVRPYMLAQTCVTQGLYQEVMGMSPSFFKAERRPVEQVSWSDAVRFCNALSERCGLTPAYPDDGDSFFDPPLGAEGFRLPTPLEWEHAARGGRHRMKHLGVARVSELKRCAWFEENAGGTTHEVLTQHLHPLGFDGLAGNVWEWCDQRSLSAKGISAVCRGGAYNTKPERSWAQRLVKVESKLRTIGFRVARSL